MSAFIETEYLNLLRTYWSLCKSIDEPAARQFIAEQAAQYIRATFANNTEAEASSPSFMQQGYQQFDQLFSRKQVDDVLTFLADKPLHNETTYDTSIADRPLFKLDQIPSDVMLADHLERDVLHAPHLMQVARHPDILRIVSGFLGAPPTISSMQVWHSLPVADAQASPPQIFHRDRDDFRFCKLFVYLSDVDAGTGPHTYLPRSHDWLTMKSLFKEKNFDPAQLPNFFQGNGRQLDQSINQYFANDIKELTGPAGSSFLVNTYGFHKGKVPTSGRRTLFQVTYTLLPLRLITDQFSIQARTGKQKWSELSLDFAPSDLDRYMFRLYLD